ncbi:MAG: hypothetical protein AMXMBFR84_14980 [Candidatus Hydrogenedentota bacterium]
MRNFGVGLLILAIACSSGMETAQADDALDLSKASIVVMKGDPQLEKTTTMLQEEIGRRTGVEMRVAETVSGPTIILGTATGLPAGVSLPAEVVVPEAPEGFAVGVSGEALYLIGFDTRGALFAVGHFIRKANLSKGRVSIPASINVSTAPKYPIRGHQIGFRNTANSYDAWDIATYEQYIRDCAIFGGNSVELIPNFDMEEKEGPVMKEPQEPMNIKIAGVLNAYGLDLWLWLPLNEDVTKRDEWEQALSDRDLLFSRYPAISHIMVPGGDPGHTDPKDLMPWMAEMAPILRKHFPNAGVWVSNQGFTAEQNDVFFGHLRDNKPDWFTGVVMGPWAKISEKELREATPEQYPVRRYPDITHNVRCQYPVPDWDRAFALTLGREAANPRPEDTAHIHNLYAPFADGFVSYSDGCHDDLNKMIWSALGWNPDANIDEILEDYGRVFMGDAYAKDIAKGLRMLEQNWRGPALANEGIDDTVKHWLAIEDRSNGELKGNWRFQLHLLRAVFDAYTRERLLAETKQERKIYEALAASLDNPAKALADAEAILNDESMIKVRPDLRARIVELCEAMLQSIGFQYSMFPPYFAPSSERGAFLDQIDRPLNDRLWLSAQFAEIRSMNADEEKKDRLHRIVNWENPGPGSFYDDLGHVGRQPHLVKQTDFKDDPGFVHGPQSEHSLGFDRSNAESLDLRLSWIDQGQTLFGAPLKMHYEGLDKDATYRVRVTYAGRFKPTVRLVADGIHEIHPDLSQPLPIWPVEYDVPKAATQDGSLDLEWQLKPDAGRGCQVAEVWLIKTDG